MANFDTSKIEGFDALSAEEKVTVLLKQDIPEAVDLSRYVLKETFDKKASEAAGYAKQLKERMSEEERQKSENADTLKQLQEELESLRAEKTISEYTAKYIALGYSRELAEDTAKAMQAGDMKKVFDNGEKYRKEIEKEHEAKLLGMTHQPDGAGKPDQTDDEPEAVKIAKKLADARYGSSKSYTEIMSKYK